ncbi:hypothetical protein GmHk_03G008790 [Glycine max]|nr:hypothetical protein GmHk_03G008790 [Glycine max]
MRHTSKGEEGPDLFCPLFSYASDPDLLRNRSESFPPKKHTRKEITTLPENGEIGGVEPAGETGGDPLWYPGGFTIMILRVTLVASSDDSSPYDLTLPPSASDQ